MVIEETAVDVVYAGFWRRAAALILDGLILGFAFYGVIIIVFVTLIAGGRFQGVDPNNPPAWIFAAYFGLIALYYLVAALYYSLQESSQHQATVGKRALGIKVTDTSGRRLTRANAFGRWFAAALSYFTLYIGFLMAAFTQPKQGLHDLIANTLVVDRWAYSDHPERQQRHVGGLAIVLALGLFTIPILGILAAIAIPAYQDYVLRAKIAEAINSAAPVKLGVAEHVLTHSTCPGNGDQGFETAESYATQFVASATIGETEAGECRIELVLRGVGHTDIDGKRFWLQYNEDGWHCSSEIPANYLPASCR